MSGMRSEWRTSLPLAWLIGCLPVFNDLPLLTVPFTFSQSGLWRQVLISALFIYKQRGRAESLPGMFALLSSFRAFQRHSWAFTAGEVHINQNHFTMSNIYVTEIQFKGHKNQSKLAVLQSAEDTLGVWLAQTPLSKNDVALMRWRERCRWAPLLMDTVCENRPQMKSGLLVEENRSVNVAQFTINVPTEHCSPCMLLWLATTDVFCSSTAVRV